MRPVGWLVLVLGLSLGAQKAQAHGSSKSFAEWQIQGRRVQARVAFAAHDVTAAHEGLDANADGALSAVELAQGAPELATYFASQAVVQAQGLPPCRAEPPQITGLSDPVEEIQVRLSFVCSQAPQTLTVRTRLLPELEPPHTSVATFSGPGLDATHVFSASDPLVVLHLEVPALSAQLGAAALGVLRALSRPRPVLLLAALLFMGLGRRRLGPALLMGGAAMALASVPSPSALPLIGAGLVAWGAFEVYRQKPRARLEAVWAGLAGAAFGWGAGAGAVDAELPVRVFTLGFIALIPASAVTLTAWVPARVGRAAARPVAAGLGAGALALLALALR